MHGQNHNKKGNFLLLSSQLRENVHFSVTFISSQKDCFLICHRLTYGFSFSHTAVNHLYSTLFNCQRIRISGVLTSRLR